VEQKTEQMPDVVAGQVGFYRPDPSGPHAVNVALSVTGDSITVFEVRTNTIFKMDRADWMPLEEMESSLVSFVTGSEYSDDVELRNRILTGRIEALADAVRAKDISWNHLRTRFGLSADNSEQQLDLAGKVTRSNGDVVDDVSRGQNVVARVFRGNYLPVCVVDAIPKGSRLLDGVVNPDVKHWTVRHLAAELNGQVVAWPARDLFQNVALAKAYDNKVNKPSTGMSM